MRHAVRSTATPGTDAPGMPCLPQPGLPAGQQTSQSPGSRRQNRGPTANGRGVVRQAGRMCFLEHTSGTSAASFPPQVAWQQALTAGGTRTGGKVEACRCDGKSPVSYTRWSEMTVKGESENSTGRRARHLHCSPHRLSPAAFPPLSHATNAKASTYKSPPQQSLRLMPQRPASLSWPELPEWPLRVFRRHRGSRRSGPLDRSPTR